MRESGHLLANNSCGMSDWLSMALISGLAFGAALALILAIAALGRYLLAGSGGVSQ